MYGDHMDGSDWLWMMPMMLFWLGLLGAVIYIAVRLATRPPGGQT